MDTLWLITMCREQVTIPEDKPCIFLEGRDRTLTTITYNAHESTDTSATFTSSPSNIVAKGITFKVKCFCCVQFFCDNISSFFFHIFFPFGIKNTRNNNKYRSYPQHHHVVQIAEIFLLVYQ